MGRKAETGGSGAVSRRRRSLYAANIIDIFGYSRSAEERFKRYSPYDFNDNGEIDIYDISHAARLINF